MSSGERRPRLADQQRELLALLKDATRPVGGDAYLEQVRESRGLKMLQTIVAWWRRFDIEQVAPLTSGALTHAGRLDEAIAQLAGDGDTPRSIDVLGMRFLERVAEDEDTLIASIAATERALTLVARGDRSRHEVTWDRNPVLVLNALLAGDTPPDSDPGEFRMLVSSELPDLIAVERVVELQPAVRP
ncbi:MAG TPA: hypothetical protein VK765_00910 [Solirubrobacteraceae bacterium]|jgi:hypothetical protein|nr:hypothetical protein [Solirubrobacteraceae bacterium]